MKVMVPLYSLEQWEEIRGGREELSEDPPRLELDTSGLFDDAPKKDRKFLAETFGEWLWKFQGVIFTAAVDKVKKRACHKACFAVIDNGLEQMKNGIYIAKNK